MTSKATKHLLLILLGILLSTYASAQIIPITPPKTPPPVTNPNPGPGPVPPPSNTKKQKPAKPPKSSNPRTGAHIMTFKFGGSLHYYMNDLANYEGDFDSRQFSWQGNAMLGVRYGKSEKASAAGIFATYGAYSRATAESIVSFGDNSKFLEIEGGFIFGEVLRLSAGYGMVDYFDESGEKLLDDQYISATTGFCIGPKNFKVELLGTTMFSQNQNKISLRPHLGLAIKLDFFRRKS
jgi:hypothetical protein